MADLAKYVAERLAALRERFDRAKERGQVELHVSLEDVETLLTLSEAAARAKGWVQ